MPKRAKPFSHKQKKQQLKDNHKRRQNLREHNGHEETILDPLNTDESSKNAVVPSSGRNNLVSSFAKLPREVMEKMKHEAQRPYKMLPPDALEVGYDELYGNGGAIDIPHRPTWTYDMSKDDIERNEHEYFTEWQRRIDDNYPADQLSVFERNIEVWRQLWRTVEMSDIVVFVVDARHPVLHFPPSLYNYVTEVCKREIVLVISKIDLVSIQIRNKWKVYFKTRFPNLHVSEMSIYAAQDFTIRTVKQRRYQHATGTRVLAQALSDINVPKKNSHQITDEWHELVARYGRDDHTHVENEVNTTQEDDPGGSDDDSNSETDRKSEDDMIDLQEGLKDTSLLDKSDHPSIHSDMVTIGLVGHPNVGKSSLINSLVGHKVVSASRTPGHTKHFQTIHLTKHIRLCDCPGLVFPSHLPRALQILSGMYNIANVQEPYSVVQYLAQRIPLPEILKITSPSSSYDEHPNAFSWSAWIICEELAYRKGFLTAKAARPDVYRAANHILRLVTDGRIRLCFRPPGCPSPLQVLETTTQNKRTIGAPLLSVKQQRFLQAMNEEERGSSKRVVSRRKQQRLQNDADIGLFNDEEI